MSALQENFEIEFSLHIQSVKAVTVLIAVHPVYLEIYFWISKRFFEDRNLTKYT